MTGRALAFDAYGTLFDVFSVTALCEQLFPGKGTQLAHAQAPRLGRRADGHAARSAGEIARDLLNILDTITKAGAGRAGEAQSING